MGIPTAATVVIGIVGAACIFVFIHQLPKIFRIVFRRPERPSRTQEEQEIPAYRRPTQAHLPKHVREELAAKGATIEAPPQAQRPSFWSG